MATILKMTILFKFISYYVHPCSKVIGICFAMSKCGVSFQYIDLQFHDLYHEVFWYEQVKFENISFPGLISAVV